MPTGKEQEVLYERLIQDIQQGEGQDIEFKEDFPEQTHDLAKELAAFATSNPATIYLGVRKDGGIVGISTTRREGKSKGKDSIRDRLAGICQTSIRPAVVTTVDFIDCNNEIVVKINIPKGTEPVYYSNNIPYIRNITSSAPATPEQVKELFRAYFQGLPVISNADETQSILNKVLAQLSDFQILWFDHEKRQVNPDLEQMRYDLGITGRMLMQLSLSSIADKLDLSKELEKLGEILQEMETHTFYMDGGASWKKFTDKGDEAFKLSERLIERVFKNYRLHTDQIESIKENLIVNIRELKLTWRRRQQYLENGELSTLKEVFRRLAYNFNRLANVPLQIKELDFVHETKQLARNVREISAFDYRLGLGVNPLEKIEPRMEQTLQIAEEMLSKIQS